MKMTEEQRAAYREAFEKRRQTPEFQARLREGRARAFDWTEEKFARLKEMLDAGVSLNTMIRKMSTNRQILLARVAEKGWSIAEPPSRAAAERGAQFLIENWHKPLTTTQLLPGYRAARGDDTTLRAMRRHAARLELDQRLTRLSRSELIRAGKDAEREKIHQRRLAWAAQAKELMDQGMSQSKAADTMGLNRTTMTAMVKAGYLPAKSNRAEAKKWFQKLRDGWKEKAPAVQQLMDSGMTVQESCAKVGLSLRSFRYLKNLGLVHPKAPGTFKRPKDRPASVSTRKPRVRKKQAPPKPVYQTVEEWLAAGGQVKRLPPAAVAFTTATISEEAKADLARYRKAVGGYGYVEDWKTARSNYFKRAA